ncbi:hypothetical protein [Cellulomonas soli]|uniref:Uncharacterized protein n=1 Tax=Cellulomonas soli TaxID=931535 RepID=A0A512PDT5_9CELL|nr:hypothetical protein [Cellulomonas soli]NYI59137.1 hypothetical protein [Cellulomonas soli]GEP69371.1 hypothetical protein CSO01_20860 [Cellulomonas soli]
MTEAWVSVGVNVVLVVVTIIYVVLTRKLAQSSTAAAESAAESARAAAESVRAQRAAIEAEVNRRHAWFKTGGGGAYEAWQFGIRPLIGAYELRKVVLLDFHFMPTVADASGASSSVSVNVNRTMTPLGQPFPVHVDEVEGARFEVDVAALAREVFADDQWEILHWSCEVTFSLSEFSDSERRVIVFSDPKMDPRLHWLREAGELGLR